MRKKLVMVLLIICAIFAFVACQQESKLIEAEDGNIVSFSDNGEIVMLTEKQNSPSLLTVILFIILSVEILFVLIFISLKIALKVKKDFKDFGGKKLARLLRAKDVFKYLSLWFIVLPYEVFRIRKKG